MGELARVGIALDEDLLAEFDELIRRKQYGNRSEAIRDLIRAELVAEDWTENRVVVGTITLLYDHHVRELSGALTHKQHESEAQVLSSLHVHLDDRHCLEVIVVKGKSRKVRELADGLIGTRGVLHGKLTATAAAIHLSHEHEHEHDHDHPHVEERPRVPRKAQAVARRRPRGARAR